MSTYVNKGLDCAIRQQEYCKEELRLDTMTSEQLQVFSSGYTRTQLSVQALLDGLLSGQPQLNPSLSVLPPEEDIINSELWNVCWGLL